MPALRFADERFEGLVAGEDEAKLRRCELLLLLESAEGYSPQGSPFSFAEALCSLRALAKFHAAAWEDKDLLAKARERLQPVAGYWTLAQRGTEELRGMREVWRAYLDAFAAHAPELLSRPGVVRLAERLEAISPQVSAQLAALPGDDFATLAHGDYKAMNVFLPEAAELSAREALIIDFQWVGVGFGMSDVAMHLCHSVSPEALRDGGEERLLRAYLAALEDAVGPERVAAYTSDVAWHHYTLGLLDWARMALSVFFRGASPEAFLAKADLPNVGIVYRNAEASFAFIERVERCVSRAESAFRDSDS